MRVLRVAGADRQAFSRMVNCGPLGVWSRATATMKLGKHLVSGTLLLLALGLAASPAQAETKLTDFNGTWQGSGNDRNTPFESAQGTACQAVITADLRRMSARIVCNGNAGLSKTIQLAITLAGDSFSGHLTQTA